MCKERSTSTPGPNPKVLPRPARSKSQLKIGSGTRVDRIGQLWTRVRPCDDVYLVSGRDPDGRDPYTGELYIVWRIKVFTAGRYVKTMVAFEKSTPWEKMGNLCRLA